MNREARAQRRRINLEDNSRSYTAIKHIAVWMDRYYLDPLIGLVPTVGDMISSLMTLPFIYVALIKIRSIPLFLAVTFNMVLDMLLGMIPGLGIVFDIFYRSNLQNFRLIVGFVEDDQDVKREVNRKALLHFILIGLSGYLIYLLIGAVANLLEYIYHYFATLF